MKKTLFLLLTLFLCITACTALADEYVLDEIINDPFVISQPGKHTLYMNGCMYGNYVSSDVGLTIESPDAEVTIILKDYTNNTLVGKNGGLVTNGATVIICCEHWQEEGHVCGSACGKLGGLAKYGAGIGGANGSDFTGTLIINGGNVSGTSQYGGAGIGAGREGHFRGTMIVNGGNVDASSTLTNSGAGIGGGADFNFAGGAGEFSGTLIVNGGKVRATCRWNSAAIGGSRSGSFTGSITVNGGTVTAEGDCGIGAGEIGGNFAGSLTVNGGSVTAIGSSFPGIGTADGGISNDGTNTPYGAFTGSVTVNGGSVTARTNGTIYQPAGIGGCRNSPFTGSVTVNGGTVNATGAPGVVGIGSVSSKFAGNILITGGEVTAFSQGGHAFGPLNQINELLAVLEADPAKHHIIVKAGADKDSAQIVTDVPLSTKTSLIELLTNESYAHLLADPTLPLPQPQQSASPALPGTGDSMNIALLTVLCVLSALGLNALRRKREE